jgi:uncharacterized membrane protein YgdD (TMEM256/DUF423 family)
MRIINGKTSSLYWPGRVALITRIDRVKTRPRNEKPVAIPGRFQQGARMRKFVYMAAILGALGVSAGAFGAHALKDHLLERGTTSAWQTAVFYNLMHAIALLSAGLYGLATPDAAKPAARACAAWAGGVVLFSGSLYLLSLGGPRWLGPITPLGGVLLVGGWLSVLRIIPSRKGSAP